jgi:GTPase-activating protein BEM2
METHTNELICPFSNLCNFISNAPSLLSRRLARQEDINRCGFERLTNIDREVHAFPFDIRSIRDEASREAMSSSASAAIPKKMARPFQKLVTVQMDKNRRDKNMRSRLQKEKYNEQAKNEKREEMLNRAMRGGRRPPSTTKHRNKKSVSALFHFMRPLSTAFGADTTPALKRTASELDFVPSGKPSLALNLTDSRVSQFINNDRSYTFQLDTEDGGHYLLQALSKREMTKWIETLTKVSNTAAKRRLTYMGSPKPQVADHIQAQPATATRDPTAGMCSKLLRHRD